MTEKNPLRVQLFMTRLSHPHLYKTKGFGDSNENPAYSAKFFLDKEGAKGKRNIEAIEDAIEAAKEKGKSTCWKGKMPKIKRDNQPFYDGDDDDDGERDLKPEEEGMMVLRTRTYKRPRILDIDKEPVDEGEDGSPYAGCYVDAIVEFWPQMYNNVPRINCELKGVRFRKDGEPFSGDSPISADDFEDDDEDDGRSSRGKSSKSRSRDDDDEKPRSRRSRDDDGDDEKPRSRRGRDEEEDEKPRSRRSRDEDDEPPARRRGRDEEEDEKPRSRRSRDEDDEPPARRRGRDDEDEDKPRSRRSRDEDDEPPPRRRRSNDDVA